MSTVTENNVTSGEVTKTMDEIKAMTLEEQLKFFGAPPEKQRYMKKDGKLVIGADGKPVTMAKKPKGSRNKPKKPTFAIEGGKLRSSETPGFDVDLHAKLKASDFADVLDFAKWEVWYFDQKKQKAEANVKTLAAMGNTPEERKEAQDAARLLAAMEKLVAKTKGSGNASAKSAIMERLGAMFAESQS